MAPCLLWMFFSPLEGAVLAAISGSPCPAETKKGAGAPLFATVRDQPVLRMPAAMPAMVTISA